MLAFEGGKSPLLLNASNSHKPKLLLHPYMHVVWFKGPASVLRGFLSFLSLVATTDWETTPLVVDPQEQLKGLIRWTEIAVGRGDVAAG